MSTAIAKGLQLWVRCGDADDYSPFPSLQEVADYLAMMGVLCPVRRDGLCGITDGEHYRDWNYISLYWGGEDAGDAGTTLVANEIHELNVLLAAAIVERDEN